MIIQGRDLGTGWLLVTPSSRVNSVGWIPSSGRGNTESLASLLAKVMIRLLLTRLVSCLTVESRVPGPSSSIWALGLNSWPGLNLPGWPGPLICCRNSTGMGKMLPGPPDLGCALCSDLGS